MSPNKRIITCSDGTWNRPNTIENGRPVQTNVQKIFDKICLRGSDNVLQIRYYDQGIGAAGNKLKRIFDGASGKGIDDNILDAYKFIVWNYEPGDEIYLFGFSRGAYTARSLGGLIRKCGIIKNNNLDLIDKAYDLYRNKKVAPRDNEAVVFRNQNSHEITKIKLIGVWDTVGALGIPVRSFQWINKEKYSFHDPALSSIVQHAYHAVAVDERRSNFEPTLWTQSGNKSDEFEQVLEQRWFAGVHSNIGGGYPNEGLSNIALRWMMEKAERTGLCFESGWKEVLPPEKPWTMVDSREPWYFKLTKPLMRDIPSLADVDESVHERMKYDPTYQPENVLRLMRGHIDASKKLV